ncbi:hypothetical protein [Methylorubrum extorquens]|uniref:Uncharacterized protein n=1 Tax=Methylorubrum extorquens DSM 13060 TaxID=882800 RepID=H1KGA0_METEX|nr:hypothetical protein [Methylorubrum extorquens]EHP93441.1 hypothetical protein MetexDRAFT_1662 [Methylorubrum extorquens DSM 13060]
MFEVTNLSPEPQTFAIRPNGPGSEGRADLAPGETRTLDLAGGPAHPPHRALIQAGHVAVTPIGAKREARP